MMKALFVHCCFWLSGNICGWAPCIFNKSFPSSQSPLFASEDEVLFIQGIYMRYVIKRGLDLDPDSL